MKKLIAIALSLIFVMGLCGCKGDKKQESLVDLEYYAKLGQMPETKFVLGNSADEVIEFMDEESNKTEANGEHTVNEVIELEENVIVSDGSFEYYYKKDDKDKKIGCISSLGDAFTFERGTVILEVKNALKGTEITEEPATEENAFFHIGDIENAVV